MLVEFLENLKKSRWLSWVGREIFFVVIPVAIVFSSVYLGELTKGLGTSAFFVSFWGGLFVGGKTAQVLTDRVPKVPEKIADKLFSAFSIFGFQFAPAIVGAFTNNHFGTELELYSLSKHFFVACFSAAVFFCVTPEKINQ